MAAIPLFTIGGAAITAPVAGAAATAAAAGTTITLGSVLTAASALVSVVGDIRAGQAGAVQAAFQSRVLHQQAAFARQRAARQEAVFRRDIRRFKGTQRALLAKSGVKVEEGSPLLLQVETAAQAELEALTIRAGGDITAARLRREAILQRMRGQFSRTAGFIGAGESLLSGASKIAERFES